VYGKQWRSWAGKRLYTPHTKADESFIEIKIIDQIANLINDLKTNPDSRRLLVSAWNPAELDQMVLPPCHYGFQVYTRELSFDERFLILSDRNLIDSFHNLSDKKYNSRLNELNIPTRAISLMWNQRSVDTFLGLPFNIASYGLLLEIIAKAVNMVPDELIGNLGDTHLYSNHIEQAKEQIGRDLTFKERKQIAENEGWYKRDNFLESLKNTNDIAFVFNFFEIQKRTREPYPLPTLNINTEFWPYEGGECGEGPLDAAAIFDSFKNDDFCRCLLEEDIQLGDYQSHPAIKAPLSN
jgi:thymidylate synthase